MSGGDKQLEHEAAAVGFMKAWQLVMVEPRHA